MAIVLIITTILVVILAALLFTPIWLYIDTDEGRYEIFQSFFFRLSLVFEHNSIVPRLKIAGIDVSLTPKNKKSIETPKDKSARRSGFKRSLASWRFLITNVIKTFRVRSMIIDLDTDDVVLNSQLVPIFLAVSNKPFRFCTNFDGRAYLHLEISNQLIRILWIFFQFLLKK